MGSYMISQYGPLLSLKGSEVWGCRARTKGLCNYPDSKGFEPSSLKPLNPKP